MTTKADSGGPYGSVKEARPSQADRELRGGEGHAELRSPGMMPSSTRRIPGVWKLLQFCPSGQKCVPWSDSKGEKGELQVTETWSGMKPEIKIEG